MGKYVGGKGTAASVSVHPAAGKLFFILTVSGKEGAVESNPTQVAFLIEDARNVKLGEKEGSFLINGTTWINLGENYTFEGRVFEFSLFDTELANADVRDLIVVKGKTSDIRKE